MKSLNFLCEKNGIKYNGVVERKNRLLEELVRTMLNETLLPKYFWTDAVNATSYVLKRVLTMSILKKTPHEIFKGRRHVLTHLKVFGCKCFILNNGKKKLANLMQKLMKESFLVMLQISPIMLLTRVHLGFLELYLPYLHQ